jgi:hypothetical protein
VESADGVVDTARDDEMEIDGVQEGVRADRPCKLEMEPGAPEPEVEPEEEMGAEERSRLVARWAMSLLVSLCRTRCRSPILTGALAGRICKIQTHKFSKHK